MQEQNYEADDDSIDEDDDNVLKLALSEVRDNLDELINFIGTDEDLKKISTNQERNASISLLEYLNLKDSVQFN